MTFAKKVLGAGMTLNAIGIIGFLGLVWLIIFGNLSGNLGFASGTKGANDTNTVINNFTGGVTKFFSYTELWFTILAIVLLIVILVVLLQIVMKLGKQGAGKGFSGD